MSPVLIFLVIIALIAVWLSLSKMFYPIGKGIETMMRNIKTTTQKDEEKNKNE